MTIRTIDSDPFPPPTTGHLLEDARLGHASWAPPGTDAAASGSEIRGFALYVGLSEELALASGWELVELVNTLKTELRRLVPNAETRAILALSSLGIGGRDLDIVRLALREPVAVATVRDRRASELRASRTGVVIDMSRNRVTIDGEPAPLTFTEIELLQILVLCQGRPVGRRELIDRLATGDDNAATPTDRAVDVQIRRLRSKLGPYQDIIGTVRGAGYRFDRRGVATVLNSSTPSPDLF